MITDRLDSVEVFDATGDLDGYALAEIPFGRKSAPRGSAPLTPVRCCRTCAWADAAHVVYVPGHGLTYQTPGSRT